MRVVVGTGLKTPTGVITEGAHDFCTARYTYAPDTDGDETVTGASVLDDLHPAPGQVKLMTNVTHGRLMIDQQFLSYIYGELSSLPVIGSHHAETADTPVPTPPLAPGSSVP
jgi:hypothetical protein